MRKFVRALFMFGVLTVLAACSSGSSGGGGDKDNGIASKSPQDILTAVQSAMKKQGTFHVAGSGTSDGESTGLDLNIDAAHDSASGFLTNSGQRVDIVRIGTTVYVKGSAELFKSEHIPAAAAQLLDGKWLKAPTSNPDFAQFTDFTSIDGILQADGPVTKGSETTVNGKKVLALIDSKGTKDEGTLYVQTTGDPLVVELMPTGGSDTGKIDFDKYGATLNITAPAGAVDLSQLTQG